MWTSCVFVSALNVRVCVIITIKCGPEVSLLQQKKKRGKRKPSKVLLSTLRSVYEKHYKCLVEIKIEAEYIQGPTGEYSTTSGSEWWITNVSKIQHVCDLLRFSPYVSWKWGANQVVVTCLSTFLSTFSKQYNRTLNPHKKKVSKNILVAV